MEIFANHAHLFPKQIRPDGTANKLLELMDECGISKCVVFAPYKELVRDLHIDPNKWLIKETGYNDKLVRFASINPKSPTAISELIRAHNEGYKGVKLHPIFQKFDVTSKKAMIFYEKAEELGIILDIHTGLHWYPIKKYHPLKFDEIASKFPSLLMILEHVGGFCFYKDAVAVILNHMPDNKSRIFAGITSNLDDIEFKYWYLGPDKIKELIWLIGKEHLIYGLDFPYNNIKKIKKDLKIIQAMDINDEAKNGLLGANLNSLLNT